MRNTRTKPTTIDEYLAQVPEPARSTLEKVRAVIRSAAPKEATETISYGLPTFKYQGGLMAFGAFKNHCSLFPMSLAALAQFKVDLQRYETSKGTIHFPPDKPLPAALLKKMVRVRVAQNEEKQLKKSAAR